MADGLGRGASTFMSGDVYTDEQIDGINPCINVSTLEKRPKNADVGFVFFCSDIQIPIWKASSSTDTWVKADGTVYINNGIIQ